MNPPPPKKMFLYEQRNNWFPKQHQDSQTHIFKVLLSKHENNRSLEKNETNSTTNIIDSRDGHNSKYNLHKRKQCTHNKIELKV